MTAPVATTAPRRVSVPGADFGSRDAPAAAGAAISSPSPDAAAHTADELTDLGNTRRFARQHGDDVRYVAGGWFTWDDTRFRQDDTGDVPRRVKDTVRSIAAEAAAEPNDESRARLLRHATQSQSVQRQRAIEELARSEPRIAIRAAELDAQPYLLNCPNVTVDLRTSEGYRHRRSDLLTKCAGAPYDPDARSPLWDDFLRRVFDGDDAMIDFVQRALGYTAIGDPVEQVVPFCYGTGANGKSVLLETARDALGEYAEAASFEAFTARRSSGGPRDDIHKLRGTRLVTAIETGAGRKLDEVLVKQLTGNDTITARPLYGRLESWRARFVPWIAGNDKPIIEGTDEAIWRRVRLIPFNVTIPEPERDPHLRAKLSAPEHLKAVLAWIVAGALEWQRIGLCAPDRVLAATSEYRGEMDVLAPFLEACTAADAGACETSKALFQRYCEWCEEQGEKPLSSKAFGLRLGGRGFEPKKGSRGARMWCGIRLVGGVLAP